LLGHFDREVIILCVRCYLRYKLSFRDLVKMMTERGLNLAHTTILRWVRRYAPEFVKRWTNLLGSLGSSWRVDETYIKVCGHWTYLYRAVDKAGNTTVPDGPYYLHQSRLTHQQKIALNDLVQALRHNCGLLR
jgi:transposase-like protein